MPRTKKDQVFLSIDGEEWELKPPAGTKSFLVIPKLIGLVSEAIYAAGRANINLGTLITDEGLNLSGITAENIRAFTYIAEMLVKNWTMISAEILPVLLCQSAEWLEERGTPYELMAAIGTSLNYNAPYIFGDKTWASLKKLFAEEKEPAEEELLETG